MIDSLQAGLKKMEELQEKADELIAYYKKLQTISIPDLITEIGDDVDIATEFLVPKLHKDELATWRKRAAKIEKINNCLTDFEFGIIEELTVSNSRILVTEIYKVIGFFEWLAGNIGKITLAIAAGLGAASGFYGDDIERAANQMVASILKADLKGTVKSAARMVYKGEVALKEAIEIGILSVVLTMIESILIGFSAEKYAENIVPVLAVKAATEEELMEAAFPQGTGRVRRRKPHRVRAG